MCCDYNIVEPLTARETQVLELVCEGMTNREIAAALVVSPKTVENHVNHILSKLGVSNRHRAAVHAFTCGLVSLPLSENTHDGDVRLCYTHPYGHHCPKEQPHVQNRTD